MYCGDETGSFIGEVGSCSSQFGYGGEDAPSYVLPSFVAEESSILQGMDTKDPRRFRTLNSFYHRKDVRSPLSVAGSSEAQYSSPLVDPAQFLSQGESIVDWDAYEHLWQKAMNVMQFKNTSKHRSIRVKNASTTSETIRPNSVGQQGCTHPVLAVTPGCTAVTNMITESDKPRGQQEILQLTEIMMETFEVGALFVAPAPMLSAFSHGRQTALIVDVGASGCKVTPVVDGLILKQAQRRSGRGGDWLGHMQWQALLQEKTVVRARYQIGRKGRKQSTSNGGLFHRVAMQDLMYELRSSEHVQLPQWWYDPTVPFLYDGIDFNGNETHESSLNPSHYELPDGTLVDMTTRVGMDLGRTPELLFTEFLPFQEGPAGMTTTKTLQARHPTFSNEPIQKLIHSSLAAVADIDLRKELASSILIVGGESAIIKNLEKRLSLELPRIIPAAFKPKVLASRYMVERQCSAWIGGSVLTSLGSFQQLWLSKTEYEEYGGALAIQRFPA